MAGSRAPPPDGTRGAAGTLEPRRTSMFERFTDRARRVLVLAQEEARLLNHNFIGTEHILLGLIHEGEGVAAKALESLGISLEAVREKVEETIGPAGSSTTGSPPFTPRAKKVLELSLREALQLGHNYIGTEHMLLGPRPRGRGCGGPGPGQPRCGPAEGAPAGHPAALRLSVAGRQGGRSTGAGASSGQEAPERLTRPRSVRAQPDPAGPGAQARPGHRAATARSSGSCRCCPGGPKTTRS